MEKDNKYQVKENRRYTFYEEEKDNIRHFLGKCEIIKD